jgi:hypothetical protein
MAGLKRRGTGRESRVLPGYPRVELALIGDLVTGSFHAAAGHQISGTVHRQAGQGKVGAVAGAIAAQLAAGHGLRWCRVVTTDSAGKQEFWAVDVEAEKLKELDPDGAVEIIVSRGGAKPPVSRRRKLIGAAVLAATFAGVVGGLVAVVPAITGHGKGSTAGPGTAPVAAPPGQLPATAPAGFGTYAPWSAPLTSRATGAVAVKVADGVVFAAAGQSVIRYEASSGKVLSRVDTGMQVARFVTTDLGNGPGVAVYDGARKVVMINPDGAVGRTVEFGAEVTQVTFGGDRPLASAGYGAGQVRTKAWTVDDNGAPVMRRIPAAAVGLAGVGGAVFAVDPATGSTWWISSDDLRFPDPVQVRAPGGMVPALANDPGAVVDGWWILNLGSSAKAASATAAVRVGRNGFGTWMKPVTGTTGSNTTLSGKGVFGESGGMLCTGGLAAWNTTTGEAIALPATSTSWSSTGCGGGRWWIRNYETLYSLSAQGAVLASRPANGFGASDVVQVLGITGNGLAIVTGLDPDAAANATGALRLYALEASGTGAPEGGR